MIWITHGARGEDSRPASEGSRDEGVGEFNVCWGWDVHFNGSVYSDIIDFKKLNIHGTF